MRHVPATALTAALTSAALGLGSAAGAVSAPAVDRGSGPRSELVGLALSRPPAGNTFPIPRPYRASVADSWHACRDGCSRLHKGNDIFAAEGTPAVAVESGTIVKVDMTDNGNGGLSLWLRGESGVACYYAHNSANLVRPGDRVARGQVIARVGRTGNARTTPAHVHFQVNLCGHLTSDEPCTVDPHAFLQAWQQHTLAPSPTGVGLWTSRPAGSCGSPTTARRWRPSPCPGSRPGPCPSPATGTATAPRAWASTTPPPATSTPAVPAAAAGEAPPAACRLVRHPVRRRCAGAVARGGLACDHPHPRHRVDHAAWRPAHDRHRPRYAHAPDGPADEPDDPVHGTHGAAHRPHGPADGTDRAADRSDGPAHRADHDHHHDHAHDHHDDDGTAPAARHHDDDHRLHDHYRVAGRPVAVTET